MPGLLQTADYSRAVFQSGRKPRSRDHLTNQLNARLIRPDRLTDDRHPLELVTVIDENVLRRPVGGSRVMRAQLQHLALAAELPTVTLQVLPTAAVSNESTYGRFNILEFADRVRPSLAYVNHALGEERSSKPEVLRAARIRFEHLRSLALDPEQSVGRID